MNAGKSLETHGAANAKTPQKYRLLVTFADLAMPSFVASAVTEPCAAHAHD